MLLYMHFLQFYFPKEKEEVKKKPVTQRYQMISGSLALLLFMDLDCPLGSRAAETKAVGRDGDAGLTRSPWQLSLHV